jgi:hypothetical protein
LRQDPFRIFASYPSARLGPGTWLALSETWHEDRARLASLRGAMFLAPLVSFDATAESILAALAAGPMTAGTLATATHTSNPAHFYRSLGWLTKLGLVVASDPAPAQPAPGPPEPGE